MYAHYIRCSPRSLLVHHRPPQNSYTSICIRKHLEILLALRNVYTRDSTYSCILMNTRACAVAGKFDKVPAGRRFRARNHFAVLQNNSYNNNNNK